MKVVVNRCFGGFGLSHEAVMEYARLKGITLYFEESKYGGTTRYYTIPVEEYHKIDKEIAAEEAEGNYNSQKLNDVYYSANEIERNDPILVQVVESLGSDRASDNYARLEVVEIPDDIAWEIDEYDGLEHVEEKHRRW